MKKQMDQEPSLELSRRTEVLHLEETRLDVIPELKRGWRTRKPSKRSDLREQSTKVVKQLLVGTMLERRLVFLPSSNRGSSRILLLHVWICTTWLQRSPTPGPCTTLHLAFDITSYPTPIEIAFLLTHHFIIYKTPPFTSCFLLTDASGSIETEVIL
jgi:hypothetical protein